MKKLIKKDAESAKEVLMRIDIAHDVIGQVLRGAYTAVSGIYAETFNKNINPIENFDKSASLKKGVTCQVCAVGAAIVSNIRLHNKMVIEDGELDVNQAWRFAKELFSPKQAVLIERAFETGSGGFTPSNTENDEVPRLSDSEHQRAVDFGEKFKNEDLRLCAIFQNIIDHGGTFVP